MQQRISDLALSFPSLITAPGVLPWEPERLDRWASIRAPNDPARLATQFILSVWDRDGGWMCGPFNQLRAMGVWDDADREASMGWLNHPWSPEG